MTNRQRLEIRASEIRQRLKEIAGLDGDALTDEVRTESDALQTEYRDTETKLRAAIAAEPAPTATQGPPDSEARERRSILARTGIADFLRAAVSGSAVTGAAAEFAQACGIDTVGRLPLAVFEPMAEARAAELARVDRQRSERHPVEFRAITPGPATIGPMMDAINFVFERTAAMSLGVQFSGVGPGQTRFRA